MISDADLKELYMYVSTHSIDVSITKEKALELIREVQDRRAYSNTVIKHMAHILNAEAYLAPYDTERIPERPKIN